MLLGVGRLLPHRCDRQLHRAHLRRLRILLRASQGCGERGSGRRASLRERALALDGSERIGLLLGPCDRRGDGLLLRPRHSGLHLLSCNCHRCLAKCLSLRCHLFGGGCRSGRGSGRPLLFGGRNGCILNRLLLAQHRLPGGVDSGTALPGSSSCQGGQLGFGRLLRGADGNIQDLVSLHEFALEPPTLRESLLQRHLGRLAMAARCLLRLIGSFHL